MNKKQLAGIGAALVLLLVYAACGGDDPNLTPTEQFFGSWEATVRDDIPVTLIITSDFLYALNAGSGGAGNSSGTVDIIDTDTGTISVFKKTDDGSKFGEGKIVGDKLKVTISDQETASIVGASITFTKKAPKLAEPEAWETDQQVYTQDFNFGTGSLPAKTATGQSSPVAALYYGGFAYTAGAVTSGTISITRPETPNAAHFDNLFGTIPEGLTVSAGNVRVFNPAYYLAAMPAGSQADSPAPVLGESLSYGKISFNTASRILTLEKIDFMYANSSVTVTGTTSAMPGIVEGIPAANTFSVTLINGWNKVYSKVEMTLSASGGPPIQSVAVTYTTAIPSLAGFDWLLNMDAQTAPD